MTIITLNQSTLEELEQVAENKGTALDELAEQAIRQFLLEEKREAIRQETAVFRAMHSQLLQTHIGEYVAIFQGKMIDSDFDQLLLYQRIFKKYANKPILIKKVTASPDEVYTFRSPRIAHNSL